MEEVDVKFIQASSWWAEEAKVLLEAAGVVPRSTFRRPDRTAAIAISLSLSLNSLSLLLIQVKVCFGKGL